MKVFVSPDIFQQLAITFTHLRWRLLIWSLFALVLFYFLKLQMSVNTPALLIWFAVFILFAALQALVLAAFIFFFQNLPSEKANDKQSYIFYRGVEWCETLLFAFLLPMPSFIFIYACIKVSI